MRKVRTLPRKGATRTTGFPSPDEHPNRVPTHDHHHHDAADSTTRADEAGPPNTTSPQGATCLSSAASPSARQRRSAEGRSWVRIVASAGTSVLLLFRAAARTDLVRCQQAPPALVVHAFSPVSYSRRGAHVQPLHRWVDAPSRHAPATRQGIARTMSRVPEQPSSAQQQGPGQPNFDSNDPFEVLGMAGSPTSDPQRIKRAYKKLALLYHPDVSHDPDKKRASDRFAKINWAYQTLTGRLQDQSSTSASTSSSSASSSWTPPHRRRATSTTASRPSGSVGTAGTGGPSTDWRDYMPRYDDDETYDAGGDSLGAIFRDLVVGAATGGRGVLKDFVDFLEQNVDGYGGSSSSSLDGNDNELKVLLRTGSLGDIGDEMDTTELVVKQLTEKLRQLDEEMVLLGAETKIATKYMEKLQLDERLEEIKARKKVVEGYIGKARKRLLSLQTRYKEMVVAGDNDPKAGGRSAGRYNSGAATGSSWSRTRESTSSYQTRSTSPGATEYATTPQRPRHDKPEDKWKDDSFGSFGRGRGSSRRQRASEPPSSSASTTSSPAGSTSPRSASSSSSERTSPARVIPPQRVGPYSRYDDKRRLRDLKVDEEFDKLKKDLGL